MIQTEKGVPGGKREKEKGGFERGHVRGHSLRACSKKDEKSAPSSRSMKKPASGDEKKKNKWQKG